MANQNGQSMFLTADEVSQLTGRRQKSKQVEQLQAMQIPHTVDCFNRPKVLRSVVQMGLCGMSAVGFDKSAEKQAKINTSPMPQ
ncbi:DUF4224 domain-containing protein [Paraneptunicella aestuarii]|uniref:DUF4224 domain-containing protein n=1 Tax=Paraneptunicella aestuarii TaxID=2831148 RepID=UPI001E2915FA|nr:DUF4224 domain-containing protein [Paraneptunicella aestuarii]UAA39132.1 DUF4224 domain-containing protein [Paraneptunicella aestuarii]